jgi:hypothetical protein
LSLCPSARPDDGVSAFGVAGGTPQDPRVTYLPKAIRISQPMLHEMQKGPLQPGEVYRFTGPCKQSGCRQWDERGERCSLIDRWVEALAPVAELPACAIRADCQAWHQVGREACRRCPRVTAQWITAIDGDPLQRVDLEKVYL